MKVIGYYILVMFLFFSCTNSEKTVLEQELKAELTNIRNEVGIPGINVAIVMPDNHIVAISDGFSDKEKQVLMKPQDKMFSGSTGKTFCAAIILQLIDERELHIDDKLSEYFGDEEWFAKIPNADKLTLKMLLNHTSGIPRYVFDDQIWKIMHDNPDKTWTGVERLSFIFNAEPVHEAGKSWGYSDTNYIILGMLIEKITGNEYYTELQNRILTPMELSNTLPANSREIDGLIPGYSTFSEELYIPEKVLLDNGKFCFNPQMEFTGGGIACTASDLARWGKMYYSGKVFSEKSLNMLRSAYSFPTTLADSARYGIAAFVWNENCKFSYGHTGFFPGYVTIFEYYPDIDISIAMQWNTDKKNPNKSLHQYVKDIKKIIAKNKSF